MSDVKKCWASKLGDCDKISREHVISQSVFSQGCDCPLIVEGAHRVPSGHLSESSLTAKILCRKHNSELSPLDAEAGRLSEALLDAAKGKDIGRPEFGGALIERWALKTLINSLAAGWSDQRKWIPSESVVRAIFNRAPIPSGCGLYAVDGDSGDLPGPQDAQVTPLWANHDGHHRHLIGGQVRLHGLRLFVAFHDSVVERLVGRPAGSNGVFENGDVRFVYRPAFVSVGPLGPNRNGVILRW